MTTNAQVLFVSRPSKGKLDYTKVFELSKKKSAPSPADLKQNEVLVRNVILGFDAASQVMDGMSVSLVIASKSSKFKPGDKVFLMSGWQQYTVFDAESLQGKAVEILPKDVSFEDSHYILGVTALTAYFGLLRVCEMKLGDTVVVSGAGGATGSVVGQLAKALGAGKVIGIAGGKEKCAYLTKELGYDAAIDYKVDRKEFTKAVSQVLQGTKNKGIDVYFDNTGGMITEVLFNRLALKARVAICGSISSYEGTSDPRVSVALGNLVPSRAKVEGFLVSDYSSEYAAGRKHIVELLKQGKLKSLHTTLQGIENAGLALANLFDGINSGKMQCRLCSDAEAMAEVGKAKL